MLEKTETVSATKRNLASIERFSRHAERTIAQVIVVIRERFPEMAVAGEVDLDDPRVREFLAEPRPVVPERRFVLIDDFARLHGIPRQGCRVVLRRRFPAAIDGDRINVLDPAVKLYMSELPEIPAEAPVVAEIGQNGGLVQHMDLRLSPRQRRIESFTSDPKRPDGGDLDLCSMVAPQKPLIQTIDREPTGAQTFTAD